MEKRVDQSQTSKTWLIDCPKKWDVTFEKETEIPQLIGKIKHKANPSKLEITSQAATRVISMIIREITRRYTN